MNHNGYQYLVMAAIRAENWLKDHRGWRIEIKSLEDSYRTTKRKRWGDEWMDLIADVAFLINDSPLPFNYDKKRKVS